MNIFTFTVRGSILDYIRLHTSDADKVDRRAVEVELLYKYILYWHDAHTCIPLPLYLNDLTL